MPIKNILISGDYLFDEVKGGAARVVWELSRNLSRKGHNVFLFIRGSKNAKDFEVLDNIKIYRHKNNFFKVLKILKQIFSSEIDIVNFHDPLSSLFVLVYMILNLIRIPKIYIFQSPWGSEYYIRASRKNQFFLFKLINVFLRIEIEKFILKHSDKIIVASNFMSKELLKIHKLKSEIIPLGVDLEKFKPFKEEKTELRKKIGIEFSGKIFFTLRNLEPRMGLENLIDAIEIIKNSGYKDVMILIGGTGSLYEELNKKIKLKGLEKLVILKGHIDDDVLPLYYNVCDAFVLPTKELEGFGLVSLEAMACGIPVLATPVAANCEVIGNFDKTLLFKGFNSGDIAEGIINFINRKDIHELSFKARKYAENFSWLKYSENVEKVFYEAFTVNR